MNIAKYNPRKLGSYDIFDDFFGKSYFTPMVDDVKDTVQETETNYKVSVDLPGIKKSEVNVSLNRGVLIIKAETKEKNSFRSFYNEYFLGGTVQEDKVEAKLEDGVLVVTLPKTDVQEVAGKQIEVK